MKWMTPPALANPIRSSWSNSDNCAKSNKYTLSKIVRFLRFTSLIPYIFSSGKRPRTNQRRTKERPKNSKLQKSTFIKIADSFSSLIPCLVLPRELRETTERRAKRYRALAAKNSALFLRLIPKKVTSIPKKVVFLPEKVDSCPEKVSCLCLLIPNRIQAQHAFKL